MKMWKNVDGMLINLNELKLDLLKKFIFSLDNL